VSDGGASSSTERAVEPTDAELLAAHVGGDPDAFGRLFSRHRDRLWAVALRTMGNPHDAADGLQDGLISAYRRADTFRGDAAVTTWLHRVVVNACLDRIRAAKVRRTEALPDDVDEQRDRGSTLTATGAADDPEQAAIRDERRRALMAALATLPAEQRAALVLVDMEGHSVAEVALMLECAEGTVKSRCARGRDRLATLLRDRLADSVESHRDATHSEPDPSATRPIAVPPNPTPTSSTAGEGGAP
jgi:RNA polymerase sigma-70 factor (ECF subfamily)